MKRLHSYSYYFLILISFAGAIYLIFHHIGVRAFWLDEAFTANLVENDFPAFFKESLSDTHSTLYYFILRTWGFVFGFSEIALRSFSAVFGLGLIIAIYFVSRRIFDKETAIVALILVSTSLFLQFYATQTRAYTFAPLVSLLSFYFFIQLYYKPNKRNLIIYGFFVLISLLSHPWCFFVYLSQLLAAILGVFIMRTASRKFLYYAFISTIFTLPAMYLYYYQSIHTPFNWLVKPKLHVLFDTFIYITHNQNYIYLALLGIVIISFLLGWIKKIKPLNEGYIEVKNSFGRADFRFIITALLCYLFATMLFSFFTSYIKPNYLAERYTMMIYPAMVMLLAFLLFVFKNRILQFVLLAVLLYFSIKLIHDDYSTLSSLKSNQKIVTQGIIDNIRDGDIIITTDLSYSSAYYYLNRLNKSNKSFEIIPFPKEILNHQATLDRSRFYKHTQDYAREADSLIRNVSQRLGEQNFVYIYYLHNPKINTINDFLYKSIEHNFVEYNYFQPDQPSESMWFNMVFVCKN